MFDFSVCIKGTVVRSNIIKPKTNFYGEEEFRLEIEPFDAWERDEIRRRVAEYRRNNPLPKVDKYHERTEHPDELVAGRHGWDILFKSLYEPKLVNIDVPDDASLRNQYVNALGNFNFMEDGNCFIALHQIVGGIPHPGDFDKLKWDSYDGPVDNDF